MIIFSIPIIGAKNVFYILHIDNHFYDVKLYIIFFHSVLPFM